MKVVLLKVALRWGFPMCKHLAEDQRPKRRDLDQKPGNVEFLLFNRSNPSSKLRDVPMAIARGGGRAQGAPKLPM